MHHPYTTEYTVKVGDLVHMPGAIEKITGIVLRTKPKVPLQIDRVQVYWIEDAEASWEPKKWLEVLNNV